MKSCAIFSLCLFGLANLGSAETICTGKWDRNTEASFAFDHAGTGVTYSIVDKTFEAVPLTQQRKALVFPVGINGAKVTLRKRGRSYHATLSHRGKSARTKLTCPPGFVLPGLG